MSAASLQSTAPTSESQSVDVPDSAAPTQPAESRAQDVLAAQAEPPAPDWQGRAMVAERDLAISRVLHAVNWLQPDDAATDLQSRAELDESGVWKIKALTEAKLLTTTEAVQELATLKPEWVRAQVKPGTGALGSVTIVPGTGAASRSHSAAQPGSRSGSLSTNPQGSPVAGAGVPLTYAELLKPQNKHVLQEFVHQKSAELERMRAAHFGL